MEGRLARTRIVGLKYDSGEISTENLEFDFRIPNYLPGHAAYILRNGGGKGVFLQALFQPLEPLADWKDGKNTVNHFFFNQEGRPINYTFHVVQEWFIAANKKVVLGASVEPQISTRDRKTVNSSPIDLKAIYFIKELDVNDDYNIFSLPLWDENKKESTSLSDWKRELGLDEKIYVYTDYEQERYKEHIEEFGFDRNTVSILKAINIGEGSFGSFFDGCTDNMGLFHHLLIPTINDKIEGIDSRNKREVSNISSTFLDTLKIAKELPDLLAMIRSIERINDLIEPLKEKFESGEEVVLNVELWKDKGVELLSLFKQLIEEKRDTLTRLEVEKSTLVNSFNDANWMLRNVDYVELCNEKEEIDNEYEHLEAEKKNSDLSLIAGRKKKDNTTIDLELKRISSMNDNLEDLKKSYEALSQSKDMKEAKKEIQLIREFFTSQWDSIFAKWNEEVNRKYRMDLAHKEEINRLEKELVEEREAFSEVNYLVRKLGEQLADFQKTIDQAKGQYGEDVEYVVDELVSELKQEEKIAIGALDLVKEKEEQTTEKILSHKLDISKMEKEVEIISEVLRDTNLLYEDVEVSEETVLACVSSILKKHYSTDVDRTDFLEMSEELQKKLVNLKEQQRIELKQKWIVQEDVFLLEAGDKNNCYIPNSDLVRVRKLLEAHKVECMYGTEFINSLSGQEKDSELRQNPALRYSLVVLDDKFEKLNFSYIEKELIRNYVVLIDKATISTRSITETTNPYLGKQNEATFILKDSSFKLATDRIAFNQWKSSVEQHAEDTDSELQSTNQLIQLAEDALLQIAMHLKVKIRIEVANEILKLEEKQRQVMNAVYQLKFHCSQLEAEQQKIFGERKRIESEIEAIINRLEELSLLRKKIEENKEHTAERTLSIEKQSKIEEKIDDLEDVKTAHHTRNSNNNGSFKIWNEAVNNRFRVLKGLLFQDIQFPIADKYQEIHTADLAMYSFKKHPLSKEENEQFIKYRELKNSISNKNARLGEINAEMNQSRNQIIEIENVLNRSYGSNWKERTIPEKDETHLTYERDQAIEEVLKQEKNVNELLNKMELNLNRLSDVKRKIASKKEDLEADFPKGAVYVQLYDCKKAKAQYRKKRNDLGMQVEETTNKTNVMILFIVDTERAMELLENVISTSSATVRALNEKEKVYALSNPMEYFTTWNVQYSTNMSKKREFHERLTKQINQVKDQIEFSENVPESYKRELVYFLATIRDIGYEDAVSSLNNYLEWAEHNMQDEMKQKQKAEKVIDIWVERSSRRVFEIVQALQLLESRMTVSNWVGERFHLIQYNKNYAFPREMEDIKSLTKEFCLSEIDYYVKKHKKAVDDLTIRDVAKTVNISRLVLRVLGDYPKLMIHIPGIEGALLRGKGKGAIYKEWETINNGSVTTSTKSGGQTLMAKFIVMAMIMRQRVDENSPLFLVSDNPFGTMSAAELLESVFSLLDLLNIQWLVVGPPNTFNVHITTKFHSVHNMSIEVEEGVKKLTKRVVKNHRRYLEHMSILEKPNKSEDVS